MEQILEQVKDFATKAHHGQERKYTPEPYVVHPIRVMKTCRDYTHELAVLSAALLHDVVEDTPVTSNELRAFLSSIMDANTANRTVKIVEELTDVYIKKDYPQWNRRKRRREEIKRLSKTSADAQTIKYADVIDNCLEIVTHDPEFAERFLGECWDLLEKIKKGNSVLYIRAIDTVKACKKELKLLQQFNAQSS